MFRPVPRAVAASRRRSEVFAQQQSVRQRWTIPDAVALAGVQLALQVLMAPTDGTLGFDVTPGLSLTLGR
jgi:hypothetical protein